MNRGKKFDAVSAATQLLLLDSDSENDENDCDDSDKDITYNPRQAKHDDSVSDSDDEMVLNPPKRMRFPVPADETSENDNPHLTRMNKSNDGGDCDRSENPIPVNEASENTSITRDESLKKKKLLFDDDRIKRDKSSHPIKPACTDKCKKSARWYLGQKTGSSYMNSSGATISINEENGYGTTFSNASQNAA